MPPGAILRARILAASGRPEAQLSLAQRLADRGSGTEAARHLAAAAHDGLPAAQTRLGLCYLHGDGVPASLAEARHWLERAADAGDAAAQTELAALALAGVSGPYQRGPFAVSPPDLNADPDHRIAAGLARRAADAGSAEGKALLGFILRLTPSLAETPDEADALYRESADAGWPSGQLGHAITLLRLGVPSTMPEAHGLLTAAAKAGLPTAHFLLGTMAEAGVGVARDLAIAVTHYRTAAEGGHIVGKTRLGLALLAGRGTPRSLAEAETWLRRAASDGDALAAAVLGDFHASPERQPANLGEAAYWYRRAAVLGHPGAAHALARVIAAGVEGTPDPGEVANWLETAIERGDDAAWPDLGSLIASASLPADQLPELHGWLQRMIREDHPDAGYWVGICVNCGIGTPADEVLARRYYLWAAGEGVLEGMVAAAEMLWNGRGGAADPDLARALFEYAAKRDHAGASFALGVMAGGDRDRAMAHFRRAAALGHAKARQLAERMTLAMIHCSAV
jgi:hypothetical protein